MALAGGSKTVAGEATAPEPPQDRPHQHQGPHALQPERREERQIHLHRLLHDTWPPLLVAAGTKPNGPVKLGTIKRPEGKIQVTFKGLPLYTFDGDSKKGEANGEGIKDVGTWHAVTP